MWLNSGRGQWVDVDTGVGTGGATRDRGIAVLNQNVTANTTISTSTNATGTLLSYAGLTFADDVEIHINGILMRGGADASANYDVYPAGTAANGDFACEFNLNSGDVIQMFVGDAAPSAGGPQLLYIPFGMYLGNLGVGFHYGSDYESPYSIARSDQSYSNGATPLSWPFEVGSGIITSAAKLTKVALWTRPQNSTVNCEVNIWKTTWTSGTATNVVAQLGSTITIPSGRSPSNRYDDSTTFLSNNSVAAGDQIRIMTKVIAAGDIRLMGGLEFEVD